MVKYASVIQPHLKVARRRLDDQRWFEAYGFHLQDRRGAEIVDQTERMRAVRPDEDMCAPGVFLAQPFDCGRDQGQAAIFAQHHPAVLTQRAEVEAIAGHRGELLPDLPLRYRSAHRWYLRLPSRGVRVCASGSPSSWLCHSWHASKCDSSALYRWCSLARARAVRDRSEIAELLGLSAEVHRVDPVSSPCRPAVRFAASRSARPC